MPAMLVSRRWLATRRVDGGDAVSKVGISLWNVHLPTKKKKIGGRGDKRTSKRGCYIDGGGWVSPYQVPSAKKKKIDQ